MDEVDNLPVKVSGKGYSVIFFGGCVPLVRRKLKYKRRIFFKKRQHKSLMINI